MKRILIIEDEPQMRLGLKDNLEFEGYEVEGVGDGQAGYELLQAKRYDLILLDIMLPRITGFDLCKKIRSDGNQTPVIMLTAKGEEIDRVLGLELGADDYIVKPFSIRELLARIKAVLRRGESIEKYTENITIGQIQINFATYNTWRNGQPLEMTHKEYEVLKHLWEHRNATVSRNELLDEVWGYEQIISTRTIDNFIVKLRQKIENDPAKPRHILTVHGIGYKMVI